MRLSAEFVTPSCFAASGGFAVNCPMMPTFCPVWILGVGWPFRLMWMRSADVLVFFLLPPHEAASSKTRASTVTLSSGRATAERYRAVHSSCGDEARDRRPVLLVVLGSRGRTRGASGGCAAPTRRRCAARDRQ